MLSSTPPNIERRKSKPANAIRFAIVMGVVLLGLTQTGCQIFGRFNAKSARLPVAFNQPPSQQQLLADLTARSEKARQLSSQVTVQMDGAPRIKGTMQVEFPNRLRLKVGPLGVADLGVDVGSNTDQFWIWTKAGTPSQPPALYFANHDEFQRSPVRQAIPVEPKWLIESLGVVHFDPSDVHYGPELRPDGRMALYSVHQTEAGPQTRVTLMGARTGLVEQQAIYDASKRLIAYSNSSKYKHYPDHQISLPQRVELHMIQPNGQDAKMVCELGAFSINSLYGDPNLMWAIPDPGGVPKVNLVKIGTSAAVPNR